MAKITDCNCLWGDEILPTDARGNNAAFLCPCCKKSAVLIVASPIGMRGIKGGKPSVCRNEKCGRKFWGRIDEEGKVIRLESDK